MIPLIVIALLIIVPFILALVLRVNLLFVFLSVAAGQLLVSYLGDDAVLSLIGFTKWRYTPMTIQLFLLLSPLVATFLFLRKTLPPGQLFLQAPPLFATCFMLLVLALPLLPSDIVAGIYDLPYGDVIRRSQDIVVGLACVMVLLTMWRSFRVKADKHGKGSKHH